MRVLSLWDREVEPILCPSFIISSMPCAVGDVNDIWIYLFVFGLLNYTVSSSD